MASKRELMTRDLKAEYPPRPTYQTPKVVVTLIQGDRLRQVTSQLAETASLEQRAAIEAVEQAQRDLAPEIEKAALGLAELRAFEKDHADRLKLVRGASGNIQSLRGRYHDGDGKFEAARNRAAAAVEEMSSNLSQVHDVLSAVAGRVAQMTIKDLELRTWAQDSRFPGILDRDARLPRIPTLIRTDVHRAVKRAAGLEAKLVETENALQAFADKVAQMERLAGREGPKKSEATLRDPAEIERAQDANPNQPLQTMYANFDPFDPKRR